MSNFNRICDKCGLSFRPEGQNRKTCRNCKPVKKKDIIVKKKAIIERDKYIECCDIYDRQKEIKYHVGKLMQEYRSMSQKMGQLLDRGRK